MADSGAIDAVGAGATAGDANSSSSGRRPTATAAGDNAAPGAIAARVRRAILDRWAYFAVAIAVLIANGLYLVGYVTYNPMADRSGLAIALHRAGQPGMNTLDPNNGTTSQSLGHAALQQLLHGHLPMWNPFAGFGAPLAGEMQSAALFPLLILQALPAGFLVFHLALDLIAGLCTTRLARILGLRPAAAAAAGAMFGLCSSLVWLTNAPSVPVPFLPMLLVGVERCFRTGSDRRWRGMITIAVATWLLITAGFPEGTYLTALFAGIWVIWRLVVAPGFRWRLFARLALGAALGAALSAPLIGAFLDYLHADPWVGGHKGAFANYGLQSAAWGIRFTPYAFGPLFAYVGDETGSTHLQTAWSNVGGYTTIAIVMLGFVGLCGAITTRRYRVLRLICSAWALLCAAKTFDWPVITPLVNHIPGMEQLAFYRYADPTWTIALIILAALAIDDLGRREVKWPVAVLSAILSAITLYEARGDGRALVANLRAHAPRVTEYYRWSYIWAGASILLLLGALLLAYRYRRVAIGIITAFLTIEAVLMFAVPSASAVRSWQPDAAMISWMKQQAKRSQDGSDLGRIYTVGAGPVANYPSYYGVAAINVNDNPEPQQWVDYVREQLDPAATTGRLGGSVPGLINALATHLDGYRRAAVEYVILPPHASLPANLRAALTPVQTTALATIYRLNGAQPYTAAPGCTVQPRSRTTFDVHCTTASTLVRRELKYPGWQVSVSGHARTLGLADGYFQSVPVPAGDSVVRFRYQPGWLTPSVIVSILALIAVLVLLAPTVGIDPLRRRRVGTSPLPSTAPGDTAAPGDSASADGSARHAQQ